MKNGVNDPSNIGPALGPYETVGPDITAEGWGQRYSSPFTRPQMPPLWVHSPEVSNMLQGRHPYRTQPRVPDGLLPVFARRLSPTITRSAPGAAYGCTSCGLGDDLVTFTGKDYLAIGAITVGALLLIRWLGGSRVL